MLIIDHLDKVKHKKLEKRISRLRKALNNEFTFKAIYLTLKLFSKSKKGILQTALTNDEEKLFNFKFSEIFLIKDVFKPILNLFQRKKLDSQFKKRVFTKLQKILTRFKIC